MRRWLAILLLLLLPAQATWAAAAGYCAHGAASAASHFGHHAPEAHGHADDPAQDATAAGHDCGHCHGQHAGVIPRIEPVRAGHPCGATVAVRDEPWATHLALRPERPKWAPLA